MYTTHNNIIFGFHGCDKTVRDALICGDKDVFISENPYDWLGRGMYFWENDTQRALQWAESTMLHQQNKNQKITEPAVVGAAICLGKCLDLMSIENLEKLRNLYQILKDNPNVSLPENTGKGLKRNLDCFIINTFISIQKSNGIFYDSVRGVFFEGNELYPNAGFREKNHIQIAIINPNCIKGFFVPRAENKDFPEV